MAPSSRKDTKEVVKRGVQASVLEILGEYQTEIYDRDGIDALARKTEAEVYV